MIREFFKNVALTTGYIALCVVLVSLIFGIISALEIGAVEVALGYLAAFILIVSGWNTFL